MSLNGMMLSGLANSHPLVKLAAKYWWLAIPAGWAMWTLSKKREKIDAAGLIQDFGVCFGPVLPIIILGEMCSDREERQKAAAPAAVGLQGPIRDAAFTVAKPVPAGSSDETLAGFPPQFMA